MKTNIEIMVAESVAYLNKALELDVDKHLNEMRTHIYEKESDNSKNNKTNIVRSQVNKTFYGQKSIVDIVDCTSSTIMPSISNPLNPISPFSIWQTPYTGSETKGSKLYENRLDDCSYSSADDYDSSYYD